MSLLISADCDLIPTLCRGACIVQPIPNPPTLKEWANHTSLTLAWWKDVDNLIFVHYCVLKCIMRDLIYWLLWGYDLKVKDNRGFTRPWKVKQAALAFTRFSSPRSLYMHTPLALYPSDHKLPVYRLWDPPLPGWRPDRAVQAHQVVSVCTLGEPKTAYWLGKGRPYCEILYWLSHTLWCIVFAIIVLRW